MERELIFPPVLEVQTQSRSRVADWGWWIAAALLPFFVYLQTMAPTIFGLDSAELTTGAYTLGIVHPPGSPLYLLLAHLFTWLPVGDVGYRVNLLSVVSGMIMAAFLFQILRGLTRSRWLALLVTWFCAFSYYIWISTLAAELYALQGAWFVGLLWLALRWRATKQGWLLPLFTFLLGLGLGNHLSLVLLVPGFAWLLWGKGAEGREQATENGQQSGVIWLIAAATGLLGLLIYLYLPLRYLDADNLNYARDYWGIDLTTWSGFWWMVSGRIFGSLFLGVSSAKLPGELFTFLHQLWSNYLGLGILLGLFGLCADWRRRPVFHLALLLMFLAHVSFYLTYKVVDKQFMFIPAYLIWGIWLGVGAARVHEWVMHTSLAPVVPLTLGCLVVAAFILNYPLTDVSQDWSARERGEAILTHLPEQAILYGTWTNIPIIEYLQLVETVRPDVVARNLIFIGRPWATEEVKERLAAGQIVYTTHRNWFTENTFTFSPVAGCGCARMTLME